MRVIPFVLVLVILLFGVVTAVETLNSPPQEAAPTAVRPTVTPRPRPTSPRPSETAQPAVAAPTARPASPPEATPRAPTATPAAQQSVMKVGNTDRQGVFIRRTPNLNDKIRPWMDGTPMTVLGPPQAADGVNWLKVRAPDGVEGYIPSQYLVP